MPSDQKFCKKLACNHKYAGIVNTWYF